MYRGRDFLDRPRYVSADGETLRLDTPLSYRIRPGALKLIVPPEP